jgi:hypothetical protein
MTFAYMIASFLVFLYCSLAWKSDTTLNVFFKLVMIGMLVWSAYIIGYNLGISVDVTGKP